MASSTEKRRTLPSRFVPPQCSQLPLSALLETVPDDTAILLLGASVPAAPTLATGRRWEVEKIRVRQIATTPSLALLVVVRRPTLTLPKVNHQTKNFADPIATVRIRSHLLLPLHLLALAQH